MNKEQNVMGKNKKKRQNDKREAKKEAVLGTPKKRSTPLIMVACGIIVGAVVAIYWLLPQGQSPSSVASLPGVIQTAEQVAYPVSLFADGKARHFEYHNGNKTIRYFIIKSSDGVVRAAFDACDVCWPAGKGYYQEGDYMVCRNCGRRFASVLVNEVKGGCNPAPLQRSISDDQLIIRVNDIMDGFRYFNFKGKA
jgi:uncharacterized membrane protein